MSVFRSGSSRAVIDLHDSVLVLHVIAGSLGLVFGMTAMICERPPRYSSRAGTAFHGSVLAIALTAAVLVAFDVARLWWLLPLAGLAYALAWLGYRAPERGRPGWVRAYAHGQGGAYIALVTALLVVSTDGPAATLAWIVPTIVGVPLIEWRVSRIIRLTGPDVDLTAAA